MKNITLFLLLVLFCQTVASQQAPQTDSNIPLHQLTPNYPVPYGIAKSEEIAAVLNRIHSYLDEVIQMRKSGQASNSAILVFASPHTQSQLSYSSPAKSPKWLSNIAIRVLRFSFVLLIATPVFAGDLSY